MAPTRVQYDIGGMSCSFCAESIRKAYERTKGVEDASVSLAHEEVRVEYDDEQRSETEIKDTLRDLGYTIRDPDKEKRFEEQQAELRRGKHRLLLSGSASLVTAGLMAYMIFVGGSFESRSFVMDGVVLALALGTMVGPGRYILDKALSSLRRGIFNQHVLLEAGAFAGLLGGFLGLAVFPSFPTVHFFAVSVFITTYHVLSEYTSLVVRTRASRAVSNLLDLQPETARRVREDGTVEEGTAEHDTVEEVAVEDLALDDRIRVKPGETVPIDGEVTEGESAVDESVATGESIPEEKGPGEDVIGGSLNRTGTLLVRVTATGDDAFLNRVARQVEEARAMKPDIIQLADTVLQYFVPGVLTIAAAAFLFWTLVPLVWPGGPVGAGPAIERGVFAALAVLVLGYPCALGMATPLALVRGGGIAADRGILMRSGDAFQIVHEVDTVILDKTGTITVGEPTVAEVVPVDDHAGTDEATVLRAAAIAEAFSEHPLAAAIIDHADERGIDYADPDAFESVTGKGVRASHEGESVLVGKPGWLAEEGVDFAPGADAADRLQTRGLTVSGVAVDGTFVGLLGIGDEPKEDAAATVRRVEEAGIAPVMITGDNQRTARAVADEVGIDRVMAEVLPEDKREEIQRLQGEGERVAMVGDGINDAPALTQADVGIAIGAGTDIAIESADVVLMGDRLGGVMDAHEIGRRSYRKTKQNLLAAFTFNGIGVAAATTGFVHPVFAMLAMVLSVSVVLANSFAVRLLSGEDINTDFSVDAAGLKTSVEPGATTESVSEN